MSTRAYVVGVDGSGVSQSALDWSCAMAQGPDASVRAVHVWGWHHAALDLLFPGAPTALAAEAQRSVDKQVEQAMVNHPGREPHGRPEGSVVEGETASTLLREARGADLLVLGRDGRGSWARRVARPALGSVVGHVLSQARMPVAVIPPNAASAAPRRIVVGVDGSQTSAGALRWAVAQGLALHVPVTAVLTWQLTSLPSPMAAHVGVTMPPLSDWAIWADELLDTAVQHSLGSDGTDIERVVLHRPASAGLLESVRTDDLLVLGDRGRGGFDRLLLGSVTRQCVEHASCPVVVVPFEQRSEEQPDS